MVRTGIDNPWRPEDEPDREPEPVEQWVQAGIPLEEAETWRNWRYRIDQARAWRRAGVLGGLQAAQWSTAGVTPETVDSWKAASIDATEAVNWHELDFTIDEAKKHKADGLGPAQAFDRRERFASGRFAGGTGAGSANLVSMRRGLGGRSGSPDVQKFMDAGVQPQVMHSYMTRQWFDETAIAWAKEGIDATEALLWKELGLRAVEVGRLVRKGATLSQTVRDWWSAGIPIDELADWIGAGLNAQEAADQRARGVTAEQAAALRALRDEPQ